MLITAVSERAVGEPHAEDILLALRVNAHNLVRLPITADHLRAERDLTHRDEPARCENRMRERHSLSRSRVSCYQQAWRTVSFRCAERIQEARHVVRVCETDPHTLAVTEVREALEPSVREHANREVLHERVNTAARGRECLFERSHLTMHERLSLYAVHIAQLISVRLIDVRLHSATEHNRAVRHERLTV